jgi:hypothetical protein
MNRWLCMVSLLSSAVGVAGGWEVSRQEAAFLVETRRNSETSFFEFKVTAHSSASPLELAEAVWRWDDRGVEAQMLERRMVVSDGPRERLVWSVVRPPLIDRRESLIRFKKEEEPEGVVQIVFESEAGATPVQDLGSSVRVQVHGAWRFVPDGRGGSTVEHRVKSDPGGGLPPWMVKGPQEDLAISLVREAISRAERH